MRIEIKEPWQVRMEVIEILTRLNKGYESNLTKEKINIQNTIEFNGDVELKRYNNYRFLFDFTTRLIGGIEKYYEDVTNTIRTMVTIEEYSTIMTIEEYLTKILYRYASVSKPFGMKGEEALNFYDAKDTHIENIKEMINLAEEYKKDREKAEANNKK